MVRKKNDKNFLLVAAWSRIAMLISPFFLIFMLIINPIIVLFFFPIILILSIFFYYGFAILGKKYKNKLMRIASFTLVIIHIIFLLLYVVAIPLFMVIATEFTNATEIFSEEDEKKINIKEDISGQIMGALFIWIILITSLFFIVAFILWVVALFIIGEKVKYARIVGIMYIVGIVTSIIFIGPIFLFIANILEIIILFNESKKK